MASNREERLHMRQRGANTRKIQEADFAFSFEPASSRTRRSSSRASQRRSRSVSLARSIHTPPTRQSRQPSEPHSVRAGSVQRGSSTQRSFNSASGRQTTQVLNEISEEPAQTTINQPPTPGVVERSNLPAPSTRKRKRNAAVPIAILEDVAIATQTQSLGSASNEVDPPREKENAPPDDVSVTIEKGSGPATKPIAKRKKRKSIGQQRKKKRTSDTSIGEPTTSEEDVVHGEDVVPDEGAHLAVPDLSLGDPPDDVQEETEVPEHEDDAAADEVEGSQRTEGLSDTPQIAKSSATKRTKRKRKSVLRQRKKSQAAIESEASEQQGLDQAETPFRQYDSDEDKSDYVPDEIASSPMMQRKPKLQAQKVPKRRRRARSVDEATPKATTDKSNQGRRRSSSSEPSGRQRGKQSSIPIVVHRMTNRHALPTILEEGNMENAEDEDELSHDRKRSKLEGPNGVDVVAQLCRETVDFYLENLATSTSTDSATRASNKLKQKAIQSFSSTLDTRLLDLSQALDTHHTLLGRLRHSKRQKADLQNEWLDLRRQREEIALKSDDIRRRNTEAEAVAKEALELHEGVHRLEMRFDRDQQLRNTSMKEVEGLEFLLMTVAGTVSNGYDYTSTGGAVGDSAGGFGLLDQVKDFNMQLERTMMVLDGRS